MHYDMCFELKMLTKKMQMLVTSCVSNEQKVKWLQVLELIYSSQGGNQVSKAWLFLCNMWKMTLDNYFLVSSWLHIRLKSKWTSAF